MKYHPARTSPSIGSQVRTAAAPETCSGVDALLLRLLIGGATGRDAQAPAGGAERVPATACSIDCLSPPRRRSTSLWGSGSCSPTGRHGSEGGRRLVSRAFRGPIDETDLRAGQGG